MELVGRGQTRAFDELYGRYGKRLLYYFYKMLAGNESRAQDFTHDLFLKIVERPELYAPGRKFSTWIFSIAHNMCKNEYRRWEVRQFVEVDFDAITHDAESAIEKIDREDFRRILGVELAAMDEDHRAAFLLRYEENFSIREISDVLNCPEGTVKSRLYYTARKLAASLKNFNPNVPSLVL
jgi:RNA polymerase sigma-70 factor (ECF subfamily)